MIDGKTDGLLLYRRHSPFLVRRRKPLPYMFGMLQLIDNGDGKVLHGQYALAVLIEYGIIKPRTIYALPDARSIMVHQNSRTEKSPFQYSIFLQNIQVFPGCGGAGLVFGGDPRGMIQWLPRRNC